MESSCTDFGDAAMSLFVRIHGQLVPKKFLVVLVTSLARVAWNLQVTFL